MRNKENHLNASARRLRIGLAVAASALAACVLPAAALGSVNDTTQFAVSAGTLGFSTNPDIATLNSVALSGQAQNTTSNMANFAVADATGSGSGWNVTVVGDSSGGKSAVFKQYCSNGASACGGDAANSYVSGGQVLAANSLTLNSTGASFTAQNGTTGTQPTHSCNSGCFVDAASAQKVISAASGAGMGTYLTNYAANALSLATPSNTKVLPSNEVYRIDLVWTLNSGP
jgi:WxL domain surface cell wall-binding